MEPDLLEALVRRGEAMLVVGDISGARLFFERAYAAGSAAAATAMGRTHDPLVLETLNVRGLRSDPDKAASWYQRGTEMGDPNAGLLSQRLAARSANRAMRGR
jgi:TPR repeat protein